MDNRIKHALFMANWDFSTGNKNNLKKSAERILINEYDPKMKGHIFCPECCGNLFRSPEEKPLSINGKAFFGHVKSVKTECGLRTKRAEGKKYESEEEARSAIESDELAIVAGFIKEKPLPPENASKEYDATKVEELTGPITNVPIGRHSGESFSLPSKFKTIRGICNNFIDNIHRYFYMPNVRNAIQLIDLLVNIESVIGEDETPRIYYGKIIRSRNAGSQPHNIRMTQLKYRTSKYVDFYIKATDAEQAEKGINDDTINRVILVYGRISESGIGLCIEDIGWGEFALLPKKYESVLYPE